jgi:hypothetical protein
MLHARINELLTHYEAAVMGKTTSHKIVTLLRNWTSEYRMLAEKWKSRKSKKGQEVETSFTVNK